MPRENTLSASELQKHGRAAHLLRRPLGLPQEDERRFALERGEGRNARGSPLWPSWWGAQAWATQEVRRGGKGNLQKILWGLRSSRDTNPWLSQTRHPKTLHFYSLWLSGAASVTALQTLTRPPAPHGSFTHLPRNPGPLIRTAWWLSAGAADLAGGGRKRFFLTEIVLKKQNPIAPSANKIHKATCRYISNAGPYPEAKESTQLLGRNLLSS